MKSKQHMLSEKYNKIEEQVNLITPVSIIEIIIKQMDRADEAQRRINKEGIVVRDMRGGVIPHPAIQIEINAHKIIADILNKHKRIKKSRL